MKILVFCALKNFHDMDIYFDKINRLYKFLYVSYIIGNFTNKSIDIFSFSVDRLSIFSPYNLGKYLRTFFSVWFWNICVHSRKIKGPPNFFCMTNSVIFFFFSLSVDFLHSSSNKASWQGFSTTFCTNIEIWPIYIRY